MQPQNKTIAICKESIFKVKRPDTAQPCTLGFLFLHKNINFITETIETCFGALTLFMKNLLFAPRSLQCKIWKNFSEFLT